MAKDAKATIAEKESALVRPDSRRPFTEEELRARYDMLRTRTARSPIYAKHRNPQWHVCWVFNGRNGQMISIMKSKGYEFATDDPNVPESQRQIETSCELSLDGFYRMGDVTLMQIPKMDVEYEEARSQELSELMVNQGKEGFKKQARLYKTPSGRQAFRAFSVNQEDESRGPQFHD